MKRLLIYRRLIAFIYDIVFQLFIILLVILGVGYLNKYFLKLGQFKEVLLMVSIGFSLNIIFFAILPLKLNGTIGKYLTETQVLTSNGRFTIGRWFIRELVLKYGYFYIGIGLTMRCKNINYLVFYIGFGLLVSLLFIMVKRMTIHNFYMKTYVIKKEDPIEH